MTSAWLPRGVRSWPRRLVRTLDRYAARAAPRRDSASAPYWQLLPGWLADHYAGRRGGGRANRRFLARLTGDARRGQTCLFLAIRLQDDLHDGHLDAPFLTYASDLFLIEAQRAFARQMKGARGEVFWRWFRVCLDETATAIVTVDARQQRATGMAVEDLGLYARVAAIFKLGSAAICLRHGRVGDLAAVSRFCDALAVVGQIADDFEDIEEDLRRGRLNFVASRLAVGARRRPGRPTLRDLARSVVRGSEVEAIIALAARQLDRAEKAIAPVRLAAAHTYIETQRRAISRHADAFHRRRVQLILGSSKAARR